MKLVTWNVNSLNVRLPRLLDWLAANTPDVVCLQETKLEDAKFPVAALDAAGYASHYTGQKTYNGVAILARHGLAVADVADGRRRFRRRAEAPHRRHRRWHPRHLRVRAERPVGRLGQVSLQARRGATPWRSTCTRALKHASRTRDRRRLQRRPGRPRRARPRAVGGPGPVSEPERAAFREFIDAGLVDSFRLFDQPPKTFSWWDYRMLAFPEEQGPAHRSHPAVGPACRALHVVTHRPQRAQGREAVGPRAGDRRAARRLSARVRIRATAAASRCQTPRAHGLRVADVPVPVPAADAGGVLRRAAPWRNGVLLVASLAFYAWGEAPYLALVLASVAFNWRDRHARSAQPTIRARASAGSPSASRATWRARAVQVRELRGRQRQRARAGARRSRRSPLAGHSAAARHLVLHVPRDLVRRRRLQAQRATPQRSLPRLRAVHPAVPAADRRADHPLARHRRAAAAARRSASPTSPTACAASCSAWARRC